MKKQIIFLIIVLFAIAVNSQKLKIIKGGLEALEGVSEYNIVFDYSNITIAQYDSEEAFLKDKMKLREDKERGAGVKFKKQWFSNRDSLYEPKFIKYFNDFFTSKTKIKVMKDGNAKYTMLINTVFVYPGYNVGVWGEESKLKATITVYEAESPDNIIFTTKEVYVKGRATYNSKNRIANSYIFLARRIAAYLRRKTF